MSSRKAVEDKAAEETNIRAADPSDTTDASSSGGDHVGRSISHYRIERKLGAGGMGQVYLTTDIALNRPAALKILPESYSPTVRERLFREAWACGQKTQPTSNLN